MEIHIVNSEIYGAISILIVIAIVAIVWIWKKK